MENPIERKTGETMGQRSQIYARYNKEEGKGLIANYYGWNYGERMISRARGGIEEIKDKLKYDWYYKDETNVKKLSRIFDTNFDMRDYQVSQDIISEWKEYFSEEKFNYFVLKMQHNNDGKLFVDILENEIRYAFLNERASSHHIMSASDYMKWNRGKDWQIETEYFTKEEISICKENIAYIEKTAVLMTKEEVEEFTNYPYQV